MKTYKVEIEGVIIKGAKITGKYESLGLMVEWCCPAENVDAGKLLGIKQAGFSFNIIGDTCYVVSRLGYTEFTEE